MKDPKGKILTALTTLLTPVGLPVYSVIPDNTDSPFIYIGDIELNEIPNKSEFTNNGSVAIELYSGSSKWTDTIAPLLIYVNDIKMAIKPTKSYVLDLEPDFSCVTWFMQYDSGLTEYSTTERLFIDRIQMEFNIIDNLIT